MDTLLSMRVFVVIVDEDSLSAAGRFSISAPVAGKHLQALEAQLKARLVMRTTRRHSLTEIGREYYERCRRILADVDDADSLAEAMSATPRGLLRVTVPLTYGAQLVTPVVTEFSRSIRVSASNLISPTDGSGRRTLRCGGADRRSARLELVARPLHPYAMTVCASTSYLQRSGTPSTPSDLAHHECLGFVHRGREAVWRLEGKDEAMHARRTASARFKANNGQALRKAALAGFGLVLQSCALVEDDLKSGALVAVLQDCLPKPSPAHLVYPRDTRVTPKLSYRGLRSGAPGRVMPARAVEDNA